MLPSNMLPQVLTGLDMFRFVLTAIPYRATTELEQGFPFIVFPHRENLVFNTGFPGAGNRFFPSEHCFPVFSFIII